MTLQTDNGQVHSHNILPTLNRPLITPVYFIHGPDYAGKLLQNPDQFSGSREGVSQFPSLIQAWCFDSQLR